MQEFKFSRTGQDTYGVVDRSTGNYLGEVVKVTSREAVNTRDGGRYYTIGHRVSVRWAVVRPNGRPGFGHFRTRDGAARALRTLDVEARS